MALWHARISFQKASFRLAFGFTSQDGRLEKLTRASAARARTSRFSRRRNLKKNCAITATPAEFASASLCRARPTQFDFRF